MMLGLRSNFGDFFRACFPSSSGSSKEKSNALAPRFLNRICRSVVPLLSEVEREEGKSSFSSTFALYESFAEMLVTCRGERADRQKVVDDESAGGTVGVGGGGSCGGAFRVEGGRRERLEW